MTNLNEIQESLDQFKKDNELTIDSKLLKVTKIFELDNEDDSLNIILEKYGI